MTKKANTLVQAFTALSPREQAEVIDLIAEYYLARPKNRQALLRKAGSPDPEVPTNGPVAPKARAKGRRVA